MLDDIIRELENSRGPVTVAELARRLDIEQGALEGMLEFLERKGKLSVYRPGEGCEDCGVVSCASCVFSPACPRSEEGGGS
jgi:predicted Zn-ribbon and HTH transcriptional regulator